VADDPNDPNISCVPDAMALFCPIVDTTKPPLVQEKFADADEASRCNPSRYIGKHVPPSIIFHGTEDRHPEEKRRVAEIDALFRGRSFDEPITPEQKACSDYYLRRTAFKSPEGLLADLEYVATLKWKKP
jgi:hypothetical protein